MREWTLEHALQLEEYPPRPWWSRLLHHWRARREVNRLRDLDDRMLADIGLERPDVDWAAQLPLKSNATLALEERARLRVWRQRRA
jgi:uncharacterized protein YjiS (DUF1127 family)